MILTAPARASRPSGPSKCRTRNADFGKREIDGRTKSKPPLRSSLQVDYLGLGRHHELIRFDDAHRIFDPESANAAFAPTSGLIGSKE